MIKFTYEVPDYEHEGDLAWAKGELRRLCPEVNIIKAYEERDYEAEAEYEDEYGDCEESIYRGFVDFEVPEEYKEKILEWI